MQLSYLLYARNRPEDCIGKPYLCFCEKGDSIDHIQSIYGIDRTRTMFH